MRKILFLCLFNGIVYFVSSLLISFPSRRAIFLNSNFLHKFRLQILRVSSYVIHGEWITCGSLAHTIDFILLNDKITIIVLNF